ncbi:MAG: hypothetical protein IJU93_10670 [Lachnospiraceae bacterium]|nr:hypothetical protein [Lachnospiraceae bacterium]
MLSRFLKKSDCKSCQFCCSYRRKSLWETPPFDRESKERLEKKYPFARFKSIGDDVFTIDLDNEYKTDDPEEEARCPFNQEGCILDPEDKPFVCEVWPLRIMEKEDRRVIALAEGCPVFAQVDSGELKSFTGEKLKDFISGQVKEHPEVVEPWHDNYTVICDI